MDAARIAALLRPFLDRALPEESLRQISTYIDLLLHWNARVNLTAVREPEQIVTRHFGESLFLARHLFPCETSLAQAPAREERTLGPPDSAPTSKEPEARVLDIGSGAGFPGLPLKIWAPTISLTLVESNHKKAAFLREAIRSLTLTNVNVIAARAESLVPRADSGTAGISRAFPADVVTLRAVERFEAILPVAVRLLAPGGRLALLIGMSQWPELDGLAPDLQWSTPIPVPLSHSRVLSIGIRR